MKERLKAPEAPPRLGVVKVRARTVSGAKSWVTHALNPAGNEELYWVEHNPAEARKVLTEEAGTHFFFFSAHSRWHDNPVAVVWDDSKQVFVRSSCSESERWRTGSPGRIGGDRAVVVE